MHRIQHPYRQLPRVAYRLSFISNQRVSSGFHELQLPRDTFDPHSDRMARHNLKTFNRF
jgi:hypothetical protein